MKILEEEEQQLYVVENVNKNVKETIVEKVLKLMENSKLFQLIIKK